MHHLHTTLAYVQSSFAQGESNLVYRLFTRELGIVFAHGQGVRELKSKNRFALQEGVLTTVTLVRGRSTWRVTGAEEHLLLGGEEKLPVRGAAMFDLVSKLLAQEDPAPLLFDTIVHAVEAFSVHEPELEQSIEAVTVLRVLQQLGYVAKPPHASETVNTILRSQELTAELLAAARNEKSSIIDLVNSALAEATP